MTYYYCTKNFNKYVEFDRKSRIMKFWYRILFVAMVLLTAIAFGVFTNAPVVSDLLLAGASISGLSAMAAYLLSNFYEARAEKRKDKIYF